MEAGYYKLDATWVRRVNRRVQRFLTAAVAALLLIATLALYFRDQGTNPPGFFLDEASIGINAVSIAREGVDEYGERMPLYFRAFGEYKNPVYIYLLAGVFKVVDPSVAAARRFSAFFCWLAAVPIALLAWRITRRKWIAAAMFLFVAFTPAIFEMGRLVFEVALYPLVIALFLLVVHAASQRARWNAGIVAALVIALAFIEYTYSAGRMLAPLFAVGVAVFFYTRERRAAIVTMFVLFVCTSIVPVLIYNHRTDGGLMSRARDMHVLGTVESHTGDVIAALERNMVLNLLPLGMAFRGDGILRHHVPGAGGSMLAGTLLLAIAGVWLIARTRPFDRWWAFVVFGMLVSVAPCAITGDTYHALRLSSFIVFVLVLSIRALAAPLPRTLIAAALVIGALQTLWFYPHFFRHGTHRASEFNVGIERITRDAVARPERPIYVFGISYSHVWWYADVMKVPRSEFSRVIRLEDVPPRSIYITHENCPGCEELARDREFSLHRTP